MSKRTFAIIGCEHAHIGIFVQEMIDLGHECIGIYEPNESRVAQEFAAKYQVPIVQDRDSLIDAADLIGSSAINSDKIDIIERCEQAGKSIMVDKPAVTNRRDLERLRAVLDRGRIEVGMLLTERFHPAIYTLKQQIDQGVLGELISIGMRKPHLLNPATRPNWFFSKEQCGGIVIDLLIHDMDLLRWFTGQEIKQSAGVMSKNILPEYPGFYDVVQLQVTMEHQLIADLYADWFTPAKSWTWGDGRIFVTGTKGFAELRLSGDPFVSKENNPLVLQTTNDVEPRHVDIAPVPVTITEDFLHRLAGKPAILSAQDILIATEATIEADEQITIHRRSGEKA